MRTSNTSSLQAKDWLIISLGLFFIASVFGVIMRLSWIVGSSFFEYKHFLHAHSHVAMLGWGFTSLAAAFIFLIIKETKYLKTYKYSLWLNTLAGIGMSVSFTIDGYGAFSTLFVTIHLIAAYIFAYIALKDLNKHPPNSVRFLSKWAIYWMLVSTLGLLAIAPVSALLGKAHPLYYASVQFFLHFQFNGWFTYGILAILLFYFGKQKRPIDIDKRVLWLLQISLILTYALSVTWSTPEAILFYLDSVGVLLQVFSLGIICYHIYLAIKDYEFKYSFSKWLLIIGVLSIGIKILIQTTVAIPAIAKISYTIHNFVIGFIHLTMLGSFSLSMLAILIESSLLIVNKGMIVGVVLLILAFLGTEILLFGQGFMFWIEAGFISSYYYLLFGATLLLSISIFFIFSSQFLVNKIKLK